MRSAPRTLGIAVMTLLAACGSDDGATTTSNPAPLVSLVLAEDGLGDVLFGFPPDTVIGDISALFGEPDLDSDWIPAEANVYGSCPGEFMRAIGWGSLVTIFINDTTDPINERFFTYTYGYDYSENQGGVDPRGLALTTAAGIGVGSTVAELNDVYESLVTIDGDEELDIWSFEILDSPLRGLLSGPDAVDTVTLIEIAPGCS